LIDVPVKESKLAVRGSRRLEIFARTMGHGRAQIDPSSPGVVREPKVIIASHGLEAHVTDASSIRPTKILSKPDGNHRQYLLHGGEL
jgi:hypothetical protein